MTLEKLKELSNQELNERFPFMIVYDYQGKPILDENSKIAFNHFEDWGWRDIQLILAEHIKPIYDNLFSEEERKKFSILEVKEKYGTLRTYWSYENTAIYEWTNLAEYVSSFTCIKCGKADMIDSQTGYKYFESQGWVCPYCEDCTEKDKEYKVRFAKPYLETRGNNFNGPGRVSRYDVEQFFKLEDN